MTFDPETFDPRAPHPNVTVIGEIDPDAFCPTCGKNDKTLVSRPPVGGVVFDETGERVAGYVCTDCREMWTAKNAQGEQIRMSRDPRAASISLPGQPTKPLIHERGPISRGRLRRDVETARRSVDEAVGLLDDPVSRLLQRVGYHDPLKIRRQRGER